MMRPDFTDKIEINKSNLFVFGAGFSAAEAPLYFHKRSFLDKFTLAFLLAVVPIVCCFLSACCSLTDFVDMCTKL